MDAWLSNTDIGYNLATINNIIDDSYFPGTVFIVPTDDNKKLFLTAVEMYSEVTDPTDPLKNYTYHNTLIGYNSEAVIYAENEIPAGWNLLTINEIHSSDADSITYEYDAEPITTKSEFYFKYFGYLNGYSATITEVDPTFAGINGEVIGIVEGEPAQYFDYTITVNNGTYEIYTIGGKDDKIEKYGQITVEQIEPDEGYTAPAVNSTVVTNCTIFNEYPPLGPTILDISVANFTGDATITLTCTEELNP